MPGTKHFELKQKELKDILDYDKETGIFTWKKSRGGPVHAGRVAGYECMNYIMIKVNQIRYQAHRLAWLYEYGCWPENEVDHINRIPTDNRIANLRDVTTQHNLQNKSKVRSSTGFLGVFVYGKRYFSKITTGGVTQRLWVFDTPEEAHEAYMLAKKEQHAGYVP